MKKILNWLCTANPPLLGVTAALAVLFILSGKNGTNLIREIKQQQTIIAALTDSISYYKTKSGNIAAERDAAVGNLKIISAAFSEQISKIKEEFSIENRRLRAFFQSSIEGYYAGHSVVDTMYIVGRDSLPTYTGVDNNEWLFIKSTMGPNNFEYEVRTYDSITYAFGYKKEKFLGKYKPVISGKTQNPHNTITGLQGVLIENAKLPRFSFGPSVNYGIIQTPTGLRSQLGIGISLQYTMFRL